MRQRFSRPGAALASATLVLGTVLALAATAPAEAAARAAKGRAAEIEAARLADKGSYASTGSVAKDAAKEQAAPEEACFQTRKKLWVEGEGWIVRRVATCR